MHLIDLIEKLNCKICTETVSLDDRTVRYVVASDLMSEVLVVDHDEIVLVTSLATDQAVRTANIVDAAAILLVNGKKPPQSMLKLAEESQIPLLSVKDSMFKTCVCLGRLLNICRDFS